MVSSTNQVRHLYVAKAYLSEGEPTTLGDLKIGKVNNFEKEIYFQVKGPDTVLKSDYIPVKNISYIKAVKSSAMATSPKKVLVTLDPNVNGGALIAGQDYILRINLRQFYGMSDQDQYFKDAAVHATKIRSATEFYAAMEKALNMCFSREVGATSKENPYLKFSSSAAGLVIEEKMQGLKGEIGVESQERVYFDVVPTTVYDGTDDLIWGKVEEKKAEDSEKVGNGKQMADLEYFLLGERGDQYRKIGWPNDIETRGMVDPSKTYDILEIHYAFTDTGVNSYRTEKDLTLAVPAGDMSDVATEDHTVINEIIDALNEATGCTVEKL